MIVATRGDVKPDESQARLRSHSPLYPGPIARPARRTPLTPPRSVPRAHVARPARLAFPAPAPLSATRHANRKCVRPRTRLRAPARADPIRPSARMVGGPCAQNLLTNR